MHLLTGHTSQLHFPLAELFPFSDGSDREMKPGFLLPRTLLTPEQKGDKPPLGQRVTCSFPFHHSRVQEGSSSP